MAVVAAFDFRQLLRIRVGQIQVAAQHRHIQLLPGENPAGMGGQSLVQGPLVKAHPGAHLGEGQMDAGEPLLPGGPGPGLHGLQLRAAGGIDIVKPDSQLNHFAFLPFLFFYQYTKQIPSLSSRKRGAPCRT